MTSTSSMGSVQTAVARLPAAGTTSILCRMHPSAAGASGAMSDDSRLFEAACAGAREAAVLASVEALLGWDERTLMPVQAAAYRGEQAAALATLAHRRRTDPARGEMLARLAASDLASGGPADVRAAIRLMAADHAKQARVPERLVADIAKTCVEAQQAWVTARAESSWSMLEPWLERFSP